MAREEIARAQTKRDLVQPGARMSLNPLGLAAVLLGLVAVVVPGIAQAQQGTGAINGTIIDDKSKKPLAEVIVTVTSPNLQGGQIIVSDESGFYRAPGLPVGVYSINFSKDGYFPNEQGGIQVRSDVTLRVNGSMALAEGKAENLVIISKPTIDVGSSSSGTTLNSDLLRRVPVAAPGGKGAASRSFEAVAEVAPGANADTYGTSISGASSPENHYSIDGLSVGNPGKGTVGTALSSEFVEEVKVSTAGYMPEFGRATGGVLSVVTKSGSNEFHGGIFGYMSPGSLEGAREPLSRAGSALGYNTKLSYIGDVGFDLGGPVVKDKLWFYVGFDVSQTKYDVNRGIYRTFQRAMHMGTEDDPLVIEKNPIYSQNYVAESKTYQGMAKLTWALNGDNRLTLAAYGTPTYSGGGGTFNLGNNSVSGGSFAIDPQTGYPESNTSGGSLASSAHQNISNPLDASLKWNSQFLGKKLLLDVMLGAHMQTDSLRAVDGSKAGDKSGLAAYYFVNWQRAADAKGGLHSITEFENIPAAAAMRCAEADYDCLVENYSSGSPRDLNEAKYKRYHFASTISYLASLAGHHILKAGFDGEYTSFENIKSNRVFSETTDGSQFDDEERFGLLTGPDQVSFIDPLTKKTAALTIGGFVQDSWSIVDKITLNIGIRYDNQIFYNTAGNVGLTLPNQWSPRLGLIFDPTQAGKSKVFANYARYYENAPLGFADGILVGEPQLHGGHLAKTTDTPGGCDPRNYADQASTAAGGCQNSMNLRPFADNAPALPDHNYRSGGNPGTLDPAIEASSSDEISFGGEYEVLPEVRFGFTYNRRWINKWIEDMGPVLNAPSFVGNPGYGVGAKAFPDGVQRNYSALTLFMTKNFSHSWLAQASYTLSSLRGNYAGLFAPEDDYLGPNGTADFDSPNVEYNRYGALSNDYRHTIKVLASRDWELAKGHRLGTGISTRARSGGATSYLAADPYTYPSETYLTERGTGTRLPWTYSADIQLSYRIALVNDIGISLTADIFNVLNTQIVNKRDEIYTNQNVVAIQGAKVADLNNANVYKDHDDETKGLTPRKAFGTPTGYTAPRVFRFGLRGEF
jgi:hypothetical protein